MGESSRIAISWSDLQNELLEKISKCLHTETDFRHFRAVCKSWRSSAAPVKKFALTPLNLPVPFAGVYLPPKHDGAYLRLTERTVYRVQPPNCGDPNFWLVKIETTRDGKSRVFNPVNDHQINFLSETHIPKVLNTLDFRVSQVCKSYSLHYVNPAKPNKKYAHKFDYRVAVSSGAYNDEYVITAIDDTFKLWYIRSGDQQWTIVCRDRIDGFRDIVNHKGQFYGIETCGNLWVFDSMFEGQSVTYSEGNHASDRHLVELFDGELALVDVVTDKVVTACTCQDVNVGCHCKFTRIPITSTAEKIIISRMDKSRGEWVKAENEFDGIIFLGDDCSFSFSAQELKKGCKRTRAFYSDPYICFRTDGEKKPHFHRGVDYGDEDWGYRFQLFECCVCDEFPDDAVVVGNFVPSDDVKLKFRGLHGHNTGVCDFGTGEFGSLLKFPEYAEIFWPPPSWLSRSRSRS